MTKELSNLIIALHKRGKTNLQISNFLEINIWLTPGPKNRFLSSIEGKAWKVNSEGVMKKIRRKTKF